MRAAISLILAVAGVAFVAQPSAQDLPPGYRLPAKKELADRDRAASPMRLAKAAADFNGDGVRDEAFLLKSTRFSGQALFVRLSNGSRGHDWVRLDTIDWGPQYPNVDLAMAIEILRPGIHQYYCFEDEKACNLGQKKKIQLSTAALSYYRFGSSGSFYFWDRKDKKFRRAWDSE